MRTRVLLAFVLCGCARAPSPRTTAPVEAGPQDEYVQWIGPRFGALTFTWLVDGRREHYGVGGH